MPYVALLPQLAQCVLGAEERRVHRAHVLGADVFVLEQPQLRPRPTWAAAPLLMPVQELKGLEAACLGNLAERCRRLGRRFVCFFGNTGFFGYSSIAPHASPYY